MPHFHWLQLNYSRTELDSKTVLGGCSSLCVKQNKHLPDAEDNHQKVLHLIFFFLSVRLAKGSTGEKQNL